MPQKLPRIPRFHMPGPLSEGAIFELPEESGRHAAQVLRLREGDPLVVFDGRGGQYAAAVDALERRSVRVRVGRFEDVERESPARITLVQAVSSGERMDFTVQKSVELGVIAIQPVLTERSVVRLSGERADSRQAHWQRIAAASCEQCGRNRIPPVRPILTLEQYCVEAADGGLRLLLSPDAAKRVRDLDWPEDGRVTIAAGPEAGFGAAEETRLAEAGFVPLGLGPRVLRTETAALAAAAALNALYGDL